MILLNSLQINIHEQNVLRTICNTVSLNFVDSGNYKTINIIHNKPLGVISWYHIMLMDKKKAARICWLL